MLSYFFSSSLTSSCSASLAAACLARRTAAMLSIHPSVTALLCFRHIPCISLSPWKEGRGLTSRFTFSNFHLFLIDCSLFAINLLTSKHRDHNRRIYFCNSSIRFQNDLSRFQNQNLFLDIRIHFPN